MKRILSGALLVAVTMVGSMVAIVDASNVPNRRLVNRAARGGSIVAQTPECQALANAYRAVFKARRQAVDNLIKGDTGYKAAKAQLKTARTQAAGQDCFNNGLLNAPISNQPVPSDPTETMTAQD